METAYLCDPTFDGAYAVNNGESIVIYDADFNEIQQIANLDVEGGAW